MFKQVSGSLQQIKEFENAREIRIPYQQVTGQSADRWEIMNEIRSIASKALKKAHEEGLDYLVIQHGKAPSKRGVVTAGSRIRTLMRSRSTAQYIVRAGCVQLESAFIAAIRPKKTVGSRI